MYRVEVIQLDLDNPEYFQYRVFYGDVLVVQFDTLEEANAFVVEHGGEPQSVRLWTKGESATAGSTYR